MSDDVFRFAFITDSQIGMNSPFGLDGPGSDKARLDSAIAHVNANEIDFVVFGGDQINDADTEETDAQLDAFETSVAALKVPHYGVIGNHEQGRPSGTWKYIERGLPVRFSMTHKSLFMVGAHGTYLRADFGEENWQAEWDCLETALSGAPAGCEHRFVVMHWPLMNYHPGEAESYWNVSRRGKLIELFKRHGVSCVLSGHWQQDIDANWQGISLITSVGTSKTLQYPEELSFKVFTVFEGGWSARRVSVEKI
ncbi:MAG: hypothetical protein CMJ49_11455 [Planctomycetaceae bacterium]|nr:hypothetical protein [Planctomycetaceae bacterium]